LLIILHDSLIEFGGAIIFLDNYYRLALLFAQKPGSEGTDK